MNPSLAEYHVPVHLDVPPIEVMWTDIPDPHTPVGARGVGEIGIVGTAAAIANAVFNATGVRACARSQSRWTSSSDHWHRYAENGRWQWWSMLPLERSSTSPLAVD